MRSLCLFVLGALVTVSGSIYASTITYTESFTGSGSLDGVPFTNQIVTFEETGDTSNVVTPHPGFSESILPTSVTVAGVGTDNLRDLSTLEDIQFNSSYGILEFVNPNIGFVIFFVYDVPYGSYNLQTSFGPSSGGSQYVTGYAVPTLNGNITLNDVKNSLRVEAVASTPEPSSLLFLATGSLGLASAAGRRLTR